MVRILITAAALLAAAVGTALWAYGPVGEAGAQTADARYVGSTEDGRVIRLDVSGDGTAITHVGLSDPDWQLDGVACGVGVNGWSGQWPVTDGHFETELSLEAAYKLGDIAITGDFLPADRVQGTFRVVWIDPPPEVPEEYRWEPCDSGEMAWSGDLIPPDGPTFEGTTSVGGWVQFLVTSGLEFVREIRLSVPPDVPGCPLGAGGLLLSPLHNVPAPVVSGEFHASGRIIPGAEPPPILEYSMTGVLLSGTEAEGTVRIVTDQPECDTGVLSWTASAPPPAPPPPSPTPIDLVGLPRGGTAPFDGGTPAALWVAIGFGALALGALALARSILRPR